MGCNGEDVLEDWDWHLHLTITRPQSLHKYTLHKLQTSPAACTPHNNNTTSVDFIEKRYISMSDEFYGILSHFYCEWISVLICMKVKIVLHFNTSRSLCFTCQLSDLSDLISFNWINLVMYRAHRAVDSFWWDISLLNLHDHFHISMSRVKSFKLWFWNLMQSRWWSRCSKINIMSPGTPTQIIWGVP